MKKIKCNLCGKNGVARLKIDSSKRDRKNYRFAKGFKSFGTRHWICGACEKKKCVRCGVFLSNNREYDRCGKIHGAFYREHPQFCRECRDYLQENPDDDQSRWARRDKSLDRSNKV